MTTHTTTDSPAAGQVRDDRTIVAIAWPTGRSIFLYTPEELADGVDVYTRHLKARRDRTEWREREERSERDA
jgi:hypothetical protein